MHALLEGLGVDVERALTQVNVIAYVVDRDGMIVWQNDASLRFIGDVRGSHFTALVAPEDRRRALEAFTSKLQGKVAYTDFSVEAMRPSGERAHVDVSSVPLIRDGKVVGVLGILTKPPVPSGAGATTRLTPRQLDVLRRLADGASTAQIADELHIAVETVRNHIRAVLAELDVHSRVEAIAAARAAGLLGD